MLPTRRSYTVALFVALYLSTSSTGEARQLHAEAGKNGFRLTLDGTRLPFGEARPIGYSLGDIVAVSAGMRSGRIPSSTTLGVNQSPCTPDFSRSIT